MCLYLPPPPTRTCAVHRSRPGVPRSFAFVEGQSTLDVSPLQGLRPDPALNLAPLPRRQASLETNLCRKGVWHVGPLQLALPIDGADTLGLLRVAGPPLTLFDLDTFAWLTERWREGDRDPKGRVRFTLYELGQDLYGRRPAGEERRLVRESLQRLREADFELEGYDARAAQMGRLESPTEGGRIRLLGSVRWSNDASERHLAYLDGFITDQLEAGHLTYLDWRILRALTGLSKRLWVYLESQTFKRSNIGEGAVALQLGPPMWQALGVSTKHAPNARRLLLGAGERIAAADKSFVDFELRRPPRRGGTWALIAWRRLSIHTAKSRGSPPGYPDPGEPEASGGWLFPGGGSREIDARS